MNVPEGMIIPYSNRIKGYLEHEVFEEELYFFQTTNPFPLIIDCGANVGLSTLYFGLKYPQGRIIAFEPDPFCFGLLVQNTGLQKNCTIELVNAAVSNGQGTSEFYTHSQISDTSAPVMSLLKNQATDKKIEVQTIHFGEYLRQFTHIDFCKVDIEGGESALLNGMISAGTISRVAEFVIEYHEWANQECDAEQFVTMMDSNGFQSSVLKSEPPVEGWPASGNQVFRFTRKAVK